MRSIKTLFSIRYLPLLGMVLPQAYVVGLWLWQSSGYTSFVPSDASHWLAVIIAIVGAAGYEAIYIGAIGWAEQGAKTKGTWVTAVAACIFSTAIAIYVYSGQGWAALLHAGFPIVAFCYTVTMHLAASQEPAQADPTTVVLERIAVLFDRQSETIKLLASPPALPRQLDYPLPEQASNEDASTNKAETIRRLAQDQVAQGTELTDIDIAAIVRATGFTLPYVQQVISRWRNK